jgi:type III pantothenate kinase
VNLVIDQGNTFTKYGVFDKGKLIHFNSSEILDERTIKLLPNIANVRQTIVSSVKNVYVSEKDLSKSLGLLSNNKILILDSDTPVPIINNYETPQTLGKDRLAALVGASVHYPGCPKLVIDAGTAITIDYLNEKNEFQGGNISPGIQTRFNALHQNTGQLPQHKLNTNTTFLGLNTQNAILSGVQNGALFEIEHYINHFKTLNTNTITFLTGGDADFFVKNLKNRIFVNRNLVLSGLNTILEYNA